MIIWVDAQLSPTLASWIHVTFGVEARALRDLGLRDSTDEKSFMRRALRGNSDDKRQRLRHVTRSTWCGNTSNRYLRELLTRALPKALVLLAGGEDLVEISSS